MAGERLAAALAAIDAANADDPNRIRVRGEERPKELAHAELVSEWIAKLRPEPGEALQLAARAHHLRRWAIPRSDYPEGRRGYHRWRLALQRLHADEVGRILPEHGYPPELVSRVQALVQKRGLGRERAPDPDVQALEDALCLVFLETQLAEMAERLEPPHLRDVLEKSLRKMSPAGIEAARGLPLGREHRALLEELAAALPG